MKSLLIVAAATALACGATPSRATVVNSAYTSLGSSSWMVSFTIVNDGSPASFAGLTIDLPNASNLALVASPGTWDSVVFQPDANLPDSGFFDSFVVSASNALAPGQSIGGFQVSFQYTPGATPGALPFLVYDQDFAPLFAGTTNVTAVPEPAAPLLAATGLAVFALRAARARGAARQEATA